MDHKKQFQHTREELTAYYNSVKNPAVSINRFMQRVSQSGWTLERAATSKACRTGGVAQECTEYYNSVPPENRAVSFDTFYGRVMRGWNMPRALREKVKHITEPYRKFYDEHPNPKVDFAIFYVRAHRNGWDKERAISTAVVPLAAGRDWCPERVFYETNKKRAAVELSVFHNRVKMRKWDMERALTTPKTSGGDPKDSLRRYFELHPDPQVSYKTFVSRVSRGGWTRENAISMPARPVNATHNGVAQPNPLTPRQKRFADAREFFKEHKDLAVVDLQTFLRRVCSDNWDPMTAITTEVAESKSAHSELPGRATLGLQSLFMSLCLPADRRPNATT